MELYTNARFISCEKENRIYTAMAVKGGHIVWLGDESSIPPRYGKAKRVDLGGATVTPAFGDTHMHFGSLCVFENTFYLMDVKNFAEAKAAVRRYADSHRKNKVLMGYGCTANTVAEHRLPEKRDLDDWTERPLMVMKYDGHAAVCNSAMLALLSDKVKSDPGCNTETGWLYQSAFYNGVNEATAYIPTMDIIRGLSGGAEYLASVGIGLVHTVEGVGFANDLDIDMIKILAPGLPQAFRIFFQTMDLKAVKKHGFKRVGGGLLVQTPDNQICAEGALRCVTKRQPTSSQIADLMFAWNVARFVKSNTIVYARGGMTLGVGAGQMSRVECRTLGVAHIWTRILSVYGPHDGPATMISGTIRKLLHGEKPALTAGIQQWDYLYAADAAAAFYALAVSGQDGRVYPLGSGTARPLKDYIEALRDAIDPALPLGLGEVPYGPLQVMHLQADTSALQEDTGWRPATPFEEGIRETIEWVRKETK